MIFMIKDKQRGRTDDSTGHTDKSRGGQTEAMTYSHASDYGRHRIRDIESNLNAGTSEHFASFGKFDYNILKRASDTEKKSGLNERKHYRGHFIGCEKIYERHQHNYHGSQNAGDKRR